MEQFQIKSLSDLDKWRNPIPLKGHIPIPAYARTLGRIRGRERSRIYGLKFATHTEFRKEFGFFIIQTTEDFRAEKFLSQPLGQSTIRRFLRE